MNLSDFKSKEELHRFYLKNPDAIDFMDYTKRLTELSKDAKAVEKTTQESSTKEARVQKI